MNEEQFGQLAGVLGEAIERVVQDANSLRRKLLELKVLEAQERNDVDDLPLLTYLQVELPDDDYPYVLTGESEELDRILTLAAFADFSLRAGDLVEAAALVFSCHQIISAEAGRLLGIELSKKIEEHTELQNKRHAKNREAKETVLSDWEKDPTRWLFVTDAAHHYVDVLYSQGVNRKFSVVYDWLLKHAKKKGIKL